MLRAFFDETDSHRTMSERLIGIGGVIFDDRGCEEFRQTWSATTASLKKPFRMAECFNGYNQFSVPPWDTDARNGLWRALGSLIVKTSKAQIVCYTWQADYDEFIAKNPKAVDIIGSPYSLCLLFCSELVADFAKDQQVFYTFESGDPREKEAVEFFRKANANPKVKELVGIGGYAFVDKKNEPTLCAADYMAWGWQRALSKQPGKEGWHEVFDIVRRDQTKPTYISRLNVGQMSHQVLFNALYGLHHVKKS